jgi:hypothetical protein
MRPLRLLLAQATNANASIMRGCALQTTPLLRPPQTSKLFPHEQLKRTFSHSKWLYEKQDINKAGGQNIQDPPVRHAPEEDLPSHREAQRWNTSKRLHALADDLMQRLSVTSQHINKYTGTDYSGIKALRQEIKEQGRWSHSSSLDIRLIL